MAQTMNCQMLPFLFNITHKCSLIYSCFGILLLLQFISVIGNEMSRPDRPKHSLHALKSSFV